MSSNSKNGKQLDDVEKAALVVSVTFIGFFVVYWFIQVQSAYSLLSSAYGW